MLQKFKSPRSYRGLFLNLAEIQGFEDVTPEYPGDWQPDPETLLHMRGGGRHVVFASTDEIIALINR
jgi:hypothetical protein